MIPVVNRIVLAVALALSASAAQSSERDPYASGSWMPPAAPEWQRDFRPVENCRPMREAPVGTYVQIGFEISSTRELVFAPAIAVGDESGGRFWYFDNSVGGIRIARCWRPMIYEAGNSRGDCRPMSEAPLRERILIFRDAQWIEGAGYVEAVRERTVAYGPQDLWRGHESFAVFERLTWRDLSTGEPVNADCWRPETVK